MALTIIIIETILYKNFKCTFQKNKKIAPLNNKKNPCIML